MTWSGMVAPVNVTIVTRRPVAQQRSIERVVHTIEENLPPDRIRAEVLQVPHNSRSISKVIRNILWGLRQRHSEVVHIAGDVHYMVLAFLGKRPILTVHDARSFAGATGLRGMLFRLLWYRLPLKLASVLTAISTETLGDVLSIAGPVHSRAHLIPNPVTIATHSPARLACRNAPPIVLQVGTKDNKNLLRVAEAMSELNAHLRVVGHMDLDTRATLDGLRGLNYSAVVNLSDDAFVEELAGADILIFASTFEGFGLPILEAQYIGTCVVTSDLAPMRDVAGGGAELVDPLDVVSIRSGIQRILDSPDRAQELVRRGRRNVQLYAPDRIAEQYASLYEDVARSRQETGR